MHRVGGSFIRDYNGAGVYRLSLARIISLLLAGEDDTPNFTVKLSDIEAWVESLRKQHCGPEHPQDTEMLLTLCAATLRPLRRTPALGESGRFEGGDELLRYLRGEI